MVKGCNFEVKDITESESSEVVSKQSFSFGIESLKYWSYSPDALGEELIGLDTVKKGTPLYGQPDWWGDDEQAQGDGQQNTSSNRG